MGKKATTISLEEHAWDLIQSYMDSKKLSNRNIDTMDQLDTLVSKDEIHKYGRAHHVNILAYFPLPFKFYT